MSDANTLTKRAYDTRLFDVNVSGNKLRAGEEITGWKSTNPILQSVLTEPAEGSAGDLTVSPDATKTTEDGKKLFFTCAGGTAGATYLLVLRYTTTNETLETTAKVRVL